MATTHPHDTLSNEVIDKLRELRQLNVDSADGFEECAKLVSDDVLRRVFNEIARHRREQADTLADGIALHDEPTSEDGSFLAAFHRAWLKVREACASDDVQVILDEAERGEDAIKEAYEDAVSCCSGSPIHAILTDQYLTVKETHDRIRDLRDAKRGT